MLPLLPLPPGALVAVVPPGALVVLLAVVLIGLAVVLIGVAEGPN